MRKIFGALMCLSFFAQAAENEKPDAVHTSNSQVEASAKSSCTQSVTTSDEKLIGEFLAKSKDLRTSISDRALLERQVNKLVEEYSNKISSAGLIALSAIYTREQLLQLANSVQNDPAVNIAFRTFNKAVEGQLAERKKYKDAGFFRRHGGKTDGTDLVKAGNDVTAKMNALIQSIRASSKMDEAYKKQFIHSLVKMQSAEFAADAHEAAVISDRYEGYAQVWTGIRDGGAGAALVVGGLITGGATAPAGFAMGSAALATFGTSLTATVGAVSAGVATAAVVGSAAGVAGGAGYGLLRGEVGIAARSLLSDDSFSCRMIQEQAEHSKQVYLDSLKLAAMGGKIGAVAGGLAVTGPIGVLIVQGGGAVGGGGMLVNSASSAGQQAAESKELFSQAKEASERGDEVLAQKLRDQARARAVDSGLSIADAASAGVGALKSVQGISKTLDKAPPSILQTTQAQAAAQTATDGTAGPERGQAPNRTSSFSAPAASGNANAHTDAALKIDSLSAKLQSGSASEKLAAIEEIAKLRVDSVKNVDPSVYESKIVQPIDSLKNVILTSSNYKVQKAALKALVEYGSANSNGYKPGVVGQTSYETLGDIYSNYKLPNSVRQIALNEMNKVIVAKGIGQPLQFQKSEQLRARDTIQYLGKTRMDMGADERSADHVISRYFKNATNPQKAAIFRQVLENGGTIPPEKIPQALARFRPHHKNDLYGLDNFGFKEVSGDGVSAVKWVNQKTGAEISGLAGSAGGRLREFNPVERDQIKDVVMHGGQLNLGSLDAGAQESTARVLPPSVALTRQPPADLDMSKNSGYSGLRFIKVDQVSKLPAGTVLTGVDGKELIVGKDFISFSGAMKGQYLPYGFKEQNLPHVVSPSASGEH